MTPSPTFDGPRLIRREELADSVRLDRLAFAAVNGSSEISEEDLEMPADGELHVIAADGKPVSQISIFHSRLKVYDGLVRVGSIGAVGTHPDYRGQGLASRLLEHCARRLVEGGASVLLISGQRGLYRRAGCELTGRFVNYTLRRGQAYPEPQGVTLRPARPEDAGLCSRLYAAEPVHFLRTPADYIYYLSPEKVDFWAERWIVELEGQPVAYLMLIQPWQYHTRPELGMRMVYDYAGSRLALSAAAQAAIRQPGIQQIAFPVPWQDVDLARLLGQWASPAEMITQPDHTARILNFSQLMADLRPYVQARLDPSLRRGLRFEQSGPLLGAEGGDRLAIVRGSERLELDGAAMSRLALGEVADEPVSARLPRGGALAEIVSALFPLPSYPVGINYQ